MSVWQCPHSMSFKGCSSRDLQSASRRNPVVRDLARNCDLVTDRAKPLSLRRSRRSDDGASSTEHAAVLTLYVLFHLTNHLFGLIGPDAHAAVMKIGRVI